jgi:hypothetical protein
MSGIAQKISNNDLLPSHPCDPSVEVGDYVYIRHDSVLDKAKSDSISTMPAIGKVILIKNGEAVIDNKLVDKDYTSIVPRESFFISSSNAGELQNFAPVSPNYISQLVGYGLSTEKILINIDPTNLVIRS